MCSTTFVGCGSSGVMRRTRPQTPPTSGWHQAVRTSATERNHSEGPRCAYWTASTLQPPEHRPTLSPYPTDPQHTAVGTVPCDSSSALALFGGSQDATALSAPGRLGAGDRFAALVMEVGSSWYGPKGVGINYPFRYAVAGVSARGRPRTQDHAPKCPGHGYNLHHGSSFVRTPVQLTGWKSDCWSVWYT